MRIAIYLAAFFWGMTSILLPLVVYTRMLMVFGAIFYLIICIVIALMIWWHIYERAIEEDIS